VGVLDALAIAGEGLHARDPALVQRAPAAGEVEQQLQLLLRVSVEEAADVVRVVELLAELPRLRRRLDEHAPPAVRIGDALRPAASP
jgi:hypothetical protein